LAIALALQSAASCVSIHAPSFLQPAPEREWPQTLSMAQFRVSEGKFDAADTVLADFAARYRGTPEALESLYWRALVRMDPSNPHASLHDAMASLDVYLADPRAHDHLREAAALRRVAVQLDDMQKAVANVSSLSKDPSAIASNSRPGSDFRLDLARPTMEASAADAEIKRLKEELAKATAELERIRKRLAQPPAKP
jgi:hypothetical protein